MSSRVIVLGSRIYAPLRDVTRFVEELPVSQQIVAVGASDVAETAKSTGLANGRQVVTIPLTASASELFAMTQEPDTAVTVFAARDGETKEYTERTGALISLLRERNVAVDVHESALTANQGLLYHRVELELRKLKETPENRRTYRIKRLREAGIELWKAHDALMEWLETNDTDAGIRRELVRQYRENDISQKTLDACNHGFSQWQRFHNRYLIISALLNEAMDAIGDRERGRSALRQAA